jgi:enamine deaminase RidA (YjgF/YER057c/UK114 family)
MATSNRRKFLGAGAAVAAGAAVPASAAGKATKKVVWANGKKPDKQQLFSPVTTFGDLVFLSGIGAHFKGDITSHTTHVLEQLEARLKDAGSSMEKVLKVNVYLNDLKDYKGMNDVFLGKFGPEPPVRTTIAAAGGIPGDSLVEIDCIAYK